MALNSYVIFLRGVNVGGNSTVKMDVLKKALIESNYENVKTYINSGNILVNSSDNKKTILEHIKQIIQNHFGLSIEMIIKTKSELEHIIDSCPFDSEKEADNAKKIVVMLSDKIAIEKTNVFKQDGKIIENYYVQGDLLYIYYHNGAGTSKFTNNYIEKKLNTTSTARNWNTILKMSEMIKAV